MTTIIRIVSAAFVAIVVGSAYAHEDMDGRVPAFDADRSGELSFDEYKTYLKSVNEDLSAAFDRFAKLDTDGSDTLSSAEFLKGQPETSAPRSFNCK